LFCYFTEGIGRSIYYKEKVVVVVSFSNRWALAKEKNIKNVKVRE